MGCARILKFGTYRLIYILIQTNTHLLTRDTSIILTYLYSRSEQSFVIRMRLMVCKLKLLPHFLLNAQADSFDELKLFASF